MEISEGKRGITLEEGRVEEFIVVKTRKSLRKQAVKLEKLKARFRTRVS